MTWKTFFLSKHSNFISSYNNIKLLKIITKQFQQLNNLLLLLLFKKYLKNNNF